MPISPLSPGLTAPSVTMSPQIHTFQAGGTLPTNQRDKEADFCSTVEVVASSQRQAVTVPWWEGFKQRLDARVIEGRLVHGGGDSATVLRGPPHL